MKHLLILVVAGLVGTAGIAQESTAPQEPILDVRPASEVSLDDFLWLNRLIIVFADSERDPVFQEQMELLAERPQDLLERDVIVITDTDPKNPSEIRDTRHPRGFGLVFIDKDGVIKLRKPSPWDVREISRSIDKTELRQQELREERAR